MEANAECVLPAAAALEQAIVKASAASKAMAFWCEGEAGDKNQVHAREIGSRALVEFRRCKMPGGLCEQPQIIHTDQLNSDAVRAWKAKRWSGFARPERPDIRLAFHRNESADEPRLPPLACLLDGAADRRRSSASLHVRKSKRVPTTKPFAQFIFRRGAALLHKTINMRMQPRSKTDGIRAFDDEPCEPGDALVGTRARQIAF
jgi:hypothetical protein